MDECLKLYYEEAYDYLQVSEESLIRLEGGFSEDDINTLFRAAHSLKGSSASVGYKRIAEITHKVEDLIDMVRKKEINLDKYIVDLCFDVFDLTKKLIDNKYNSIVSNELDEKEKILKEKITEILIKNNENELNHNSDKNFDDILTLFNNDFFGYVVFDPESIMIPVRRFMFLSELKEIGNITYSRPSIEFMSDYASIDETNKYQFIINTNKTSEYLRMKLRGEEVKTFKIIDISGEKIENNEAILTEKNFLFFQELFKNYCSIGVCLFKEDNLKDHNEKEETINWLKNFANSFCRDFRIELNPRLILGMKEDMQLLVELLVMFKRYKRNKSERMIAIIQKLYINMWDKIYEIAEDKLIYKPVKINDSKQLEELKENFNSISNKLFEFVMLDISQLEIIEHNSLNAIIEMKKSFKKNNIRLLIINNGIYRKRIYNIFESIGELEDLKLYYSNLEAALGMNWGNKRYYLRYQKDGESCG